MKILIVNEQDEIIGSKDSEERDLLNEITRITGLWVLNEKGECLIAKRSKNKKALPNLWGPSVAGSVEEGETYESNIIKEAGEEIGLKITEKDLMLGPKIRKTTRHAYFCQWFLVKVSSDTNFILQETEVDEIQWITFQDLLKWCEKEPEKFLPNFIDNMGVKALKEYAAQNQKTER